MIAPVPADDEEEIVELGAGTGVLTFRLAARCPRARILCCDGFLDWVLELRRDIGIPDTLAEIGVHEQHAAAFAPQALGDPSTGGNPQPMTEDDYRILYLNCIRGTL